MNGAAVSGLQLAIMLLWPETTVKMRGNSKFENE